MLACRALCAAAAASRCRSTHRMERLGPRGDCGRGSQQPHVAPTAGASWGAGVACAAASEHTV